MKLNLFTLMIGLSCVLLLSCRPSKLISLPNGKKIDQHLVGTWYGSEKDKQIEGVEKKWEMIRNADGTFILNFQTISGDDVDKFTEKGNWWVEKNRFYEYHDYSKRTDSYTYEILNDKQVKFKSIKINVEMNTAGYEFIDTKK